MAPSPRAGISTAAEAPPPASVAGLAAWLSRSAFA